MDMFGLEKYAQVFETKPINEFNVSLVFHGQKGIGKLDFVLSLIKKVVKSESNIHIVQADEDKRDISIEQIRTLFNDIMLVPSDGDKHYVIINNAEQLNEASGNALLKRLEEPKQTEQFILITNNYDSLLDTIKSRCFSFYMYVDNSYLESKLSNEPIETKQVLMQRGVKEIKAYLNLDANKSKYKEALSLAKEVSMLNNSSKIAYYINKLSKADVLLFLEYLKIIVTNEQTLIDVNKAYERVVQNKNKNEIILTILLSNIILNNK